MRSFKISVVKTLMVFFTMLMLGTTILAQVTVTFPTVSGIGGQSKQGNITVANLPANTNSFQFVLPYTSSVVTITGVDATGTMIAGNSTYLTVNTTVTGQISVAWASDVPISGSGTLLKLNFTFGSAGTTALNPGTSFMYNTTPVLPANITPGSATTPSIGITVADVSNAKVGQTFYIPVNTTALTAGNNIYSFNFNATFDRTKFTIVGYETAPTGLTAALTNNLGSFQLNANNTTGTLSLAWANGTQALSGTGTLVYLVAQGVAKGGPTTVAITSFMFNAGVPTVATFDGAMTVINSAPAFGTNTSSFTIAENAALAFTLSASDVDPGDVLTYSVTTTATGYTFNTATGAFSWTPSYTQAGSYTFTFGVTDGTASATPLVVTVTVTDVNRAPTLSFASNPAAVGNAVTAAENSPLTITLTGSDLDTDNTLQYSMVTTPATITGAALSAAGVFTWTPDYTQSGSYSVVFTVRDYKGTTAMGGSASVTVTITVTNVNRAPVFTAVIPSGTIVPVHKAPNPVYYNFQYVANDPDGQPISFSLIAAPNGASITTNGLFSWSPAVAQAGSSFVVTVQVSDGTLTTLSTVIIYASSTVTSVDEWSGIPTDYTLMQNYPNPFNPSTTIRFGLPNDSNVRLSVFNVLGQEVAVLVNSNLSAGYHKFDFDASKLTSGIYIYKIQAEKFVEVKKMLLMK